MFVLNKNDLWSALKEYPDARKLLIAKGREILRKDNLLDENAPEEQMSAEEIAENLQNSLRNVQIRFEGVKRINNPSDDHFYRMARFVAEFTSTKSKLLRRIEFLESQLNRYQLPSNDVPTNSNAVQSNELSEI
ncbi:unnamed protein product [Anisakis simplex]|uniref:Cyclic nucleotide-gated channel C-terminal leucine zipper domain-containing protein n=1 Tax=Anisakis simplex TaxID=6269 RepID=A0A3P6P5M2_ANISI|nr:unnamed protein product [Anisakis simplex]